MVKNYFELLEGKYATLAGPFTPNQEAVSICGCLEKGKGVLWCSDNSKTIKSFLIYVSSLPTCIARL